MLGEIMTRGKCRPNSESNSFAAAAEQVCLQRVLEHRQRRGRFILSPTAGSIINTALYNTAPPPTRGGRGKNRHTPGGRVRGCAVWVGVSRRPELHDDAQSYRFQMFTAVDRPARFIHPPTQLRTREIAHAGGQVTWYAGHLPPTISAPVWG